MKICKERFKSLLRFRRKNSGPWDECDCENKCDNPDEYEVPDDYDIEYIMKAIEFYESYLLDKQKRKNKIT